MFAEIHPEIIRAGAYLAELALRLIPLLLTAIFLAEIARMKLGKDKLQQILAGSRPWEGRLRAAALGAVLPFCECGAFPLMLGLLRAGVPLGAVLTFFIVSPVISVPAFLVLAGLFGMQLAFFYLGITVAAAIGGSLLLELGGKKWGVFRSDFSIAHENTGCCPAPGTDEECCAAESDSSGTEKCCAPGSSTAGAAAGQVKLAALARPAWLNTISIFKKILPYSIAAMLLAAIMHTFVPPQSMERVLEAGAPFDVPLAAAAGIPIYTGDCAMMALVAPLMSATGAIGPIVAFIIAGTGTSINGLIFMSSIFCRRFLAMYLVLIFLIALTAGYTLSAFISG